MDLNRTQSMTDVIHKSIDYSGIEREILGTPIFNRLHRVLQSSLAFLTYSSNKTKRFEHSIGVMHLAGKMFFSSVCNTDLEILKHFFNEIKEAIKNWRKEKPAEHFSMVVPRNCISKYSENRILSIPIPESQIYIKYFPENISKLKEEDKVAYYIAFQAIRIAGLLHDVGHMPYSHVLEYAINNLYSRILAIPVKNRNANQKQFIEELFNYCDPSCEDKDEIHEEIGKICAIKIFECIANSIIKKEDNFFFIATYDFACSILQSKPSENNIYSDLHQIVAGIVDADRLDYCSRDIFCAGINKEIFNYTRFFATYSICQQNADKPLQGENVDNIIKRERFYFCPHVKNVPLIEELLNRRWDIFSFINYHHRVHKHEILLEEVISDLGFEELSEDKVIEPLQQGVLPLKIYSIWQIIRLLKGNNPPEYLLIQFDDSWLDTLLKRKFFYKYNDDFMWSSAHANDKSWNRFDELISSQKHYYSAFKRSEDFRDIDCKLFEKFKGFLLASSQTELSNELKEKLLADLNGIDDYNSFLTRKKSLFFNWLINSSILKIAVLRADRCELFSQIQEEINKKLSTEDGKVQDIILRDSTFKSGCTTAKSILMIADNKIAKPFQNYSIIEHVFQEKRNHSLPIHLYYLPKYSEDAENFDDFKVDKANDIYPQLVETIWDIIKQRITFVAKLEKQEVSK